MGFHPLNLGLRFLLELAALFAIGIWGKSLNDGLLGYVWMVVFPILGAVAWGTFRTPDDRSASGDAPVAVPGWIRLLLEWFIFVWAVWGLLETGNWTSAYLLAGITVFHYLISYDRVTWLFNQR
jgi:hypothetical protein